MRIPLSGDDFKKYNNHLSTLKVTQQASPNMTVKVSPGGFWFNNETFVDFAGGSSKTITVPTSGTKFVIVGLSKSANIELIDGVAEVYPKVPKIQYGILPLAIVLVKPNTKILTEENIFDVRQVFQAPNFTSDHWEIKGRDEEDSHPIEAITGLKNALDERITVANLGNYLMDKADINGTPSNEFILNNDENQLPIDWAGITIERGTEDNVTLMWDEISDRWVIDQDLAIDGKDNGLVFQSPENGLFKLHINDLKALTLTDLSTGTEVAIGGSGNGSGEVKLDNQDTAGYLADKIDTNFLQIDSVNSKVTLNPTFIYKVVLNSSDTTPDYIENKLDANTLVVDPVANTIGVKSGSFEPAGAVATHESTFDHTNIGKVNLSSTDLTAGYLVDKVDSTIFEVNASNKLAVKADKLKEAVTIHESTFNHGAIGKVFLNALDTTADFIGNKLFVDNFEVIDVAGESKVAIRADQFEDFGAITTHESTYNHGNIGKVLLNAFDSTAGYLFSKFDTNNFDVLNNKVVIKDGLFEPAGTITTHESTFNHANIGKVMINSADTADYLPSKFSTKNFETANGKIQLLPAMFDTNTLTYNTTTQVVSVKNTISSDFEITDPTKGVILAAPNGKKFRLTVDDTGIITTTEVI